MGTLEIGVWIINIMKVFICLSALFALAHCGPLNAFLTSGAAAGPLHPAHGALVATKRGFRNIALEGFSEDDNQDGFVDPIGQVAPVVYAAPHVVAPYAYHHVAAAAPVTYTHTVPAGHLVHPFGFGWGLPVAAAAAAPAAEEGGVVDA